MSVNGHELPRGTTIQEYAVRGDTNAVVPKVDVLQSLKTYFGKSTALDTAVPVIATSEFTTNAGKKFVITNITFTNLESAVSEIQLFDDATAAANQIDDVEVAITDSIPRTNENGIYVLTTGLGFKQQSGSAYANGCTVAVSGTWVDT